METIKFENKEYVWEDIPNKGKCLVPYVKPKPTIKVGEIYDNHGYHNMVVSFNGNYGLIQLNDPYRNHSKGCSIFGSRNNLDDLAKIVIEDYRMTKVE